MLKDNIIKLYGDDQSARYTLLIKKHDELFGKSEYAFSSPGRIELVGNHTDHNHGKVLGCAINLDTVAIVSKREDNLINVNSMGYEPFSVDISDIKADPKYYGTSFAVVRGVVDYFLRAGKRVGGFNAVLDSNVPRGAGVSSSASFEVLICKILSYLYNSDSIDAIFMAKASHYAETEHFGKPCGLLDQLAIAEGGVTYMDFKDAEPKVDSISPDFGDVSIVLITAGGDHSSLTPHYAGIRTDMEAVAQELGGETLRDVAEDGIYTSMPTLMSKLGGRAILRAMHFYEENIRVDTAYSALKEGDMDVFYDCITESGDSSYKLLQNCYVPGETVESIPLALAIAERYEGVKAYRVHGGGFAGTVLTFVDNKVVAEYVGYLKAIFPDVNVLKIRKLGPTMVGEINE